MELWQLMNPAVRRVRSLHRTPIGWFRVWWRNKTGEYPWFVRAM
jgi:hypothetical protein